MQLLFNVDCGIDSYAKFSIEINKGCSRKNGIGGGTEINKN